MTVSGKEKGSYRLNDAWFPGYLGSLWGAYSCCLALTIWEAPEGNISEEGRWTFTVVETDRQSTSLQNITPAQSDTHYLDWAGRVLSAIQEKTIQIKVFKMKEIFLSSRSPFWRDSNVILEGLQNNSRIGTICWKERVSTCKHLKNGRRQIVSYGPNLEKTAIQMSIDTLGCQGVWLQICHRPVGIVV